MKNFKKNVIPMQQIGFPIQVPFIPKEDDPVRLLFEVTEGLDYTNLYKTYSTLGRNPAVDPVTLFRSEERRVGKECRSRWSPYH